MRPSNHQLCQFVFLLIFPFVSLLAQEAEYNFENDITDSSTNSYDLTFLDLNVPATPSTEIFLDGLNGKAIELAPEAALQLPLALGQFMLNEDEFEVEFSYNLTSFGDWTFENGPFSGETELFNFRAEIGTTSPGIKINLQKIGETDEYRMAVNYSDGTGGQSGSDFSYWVLVGEFSKDEWVDVLLKVDLVGRKWTLKANDAYVEAIFDPNFDVDHFKQGLSQTTPYFGWIEGQAGQMDYQPDRYTNFILLDEVKIYAPYRPSDLDVLREALIAVTNHVNESNVLTQTELDDYTNDIISNYQGSYFDAETEILNYTNTYEAKYEPLFTNRDLQNVYEMSKEAQIIYYLQQYILDDVFVSGNLDLVDGVKFEAAEVFPGAINTNAPRIASETFDINSTFISDQGYQREGRDAIRPTGYYVAPGEIATLEFPSTAVNSGIQVRVGAHAWNLANKVTNINRFPRIAKVFDVTQESMKIANPFGGAIYIIVPDKLDLGWMNITFQNVIKAPFYRPIDGHEASYADFAADLANDYVPWIDIESESIMFTYPSSAVGNHDVVAAMEKWEELWEAAHMATGRPFPRTRSEYQMFDSRGPYDAHSAGYPMITGHTGSPFAYFENNSNNHLRVLEENYVQTADHGLLVHELGHNMEFPILPREAETIVQLLGVPMYHLGLDLPIDEATSWVENEAHTRDMAAMNWLIAHNFRNNQPMFCDPTMPEDVCDEKRYQIRGFMKYVDIAMLFGWEELGRIFGAYYDRFKAADWDATDVPYIQEEDMIRTATETLGYNVTPLLHFWGLIPSESLKTDLDSYPHKTEIIDRLNYYKSIVPDTKDEFQPWYDLLRPTVDPVHYDRYDWTLANYDTENLGQVIKDQIDYLLFYYYDFLSADSFDEDGLKIYPNPASSIIYIQSQNSDKFDVSLYDIRGRLVAKKEQTDYLDIEPLTNGIYLMKIKNSDGNMLVKKISVNR